MSLLAILYWVILVLAVIGVVFLAATWPHAGNLSILALFILIGLKIFRTPLE
jgi:hypothetical protein